MSFCFLSTRTVWGVSLKGALMRFLQQITQSGNIAVQLSLSININQCGDWKGPDECPLFVIHFTSLLGDWVPLCQIELLPAVQYWVSTKREPCQPQWESRQKNEQGTLYCKLLLSASGYFW